jgi:ABC-type Mn2+/Zn2+ transport system permease subunit
LISTLGVVAIPFGNPKFIGEAIIVELLFVSLSVLIWRGYAKPLYACIALALTVIIGNTTSPAHIHLMTTFSKPINALILIVGGYILQGILIYTSLKAMLRIRRLRSLTQPSTI